jgi:hypothetical protein
MTRFKSRQDKKNLAYYHRGYYILTRHDDGYSICVASDFRWVVGFKFSEWQEAKTRFLELTK